MNILLLIVSIISFLIVDCRDFDDERKSGYSADEPKQLKERIDTRETRDSDDEVKDRDFFDGRKRRKTVGKNQTVTSPVDVRVKNLPTTILEEVFTQRTDATSPDDKEDGYAGDHDISFTASIVDSFMSKNSEDKHKCMTSQQCSKKGGQCVEDGTCSSIVINATCSKKCSCCVKGDAAGSPRKRKNGTVGQRRIRKGKCPVNFEEIGNNCYYISFVNAVAPTNWDDARTHCKSLGPIGGRLVDLAELDIHKYARSTPLVLLRLTALRLEWNGAWAYWLGSKALDPSTQQSWYWIFSGRSLNLLDPHWWGDQPNKPPSTSSGNCLVAFNDGYAGYTRCYFGNWGCDKVQAFVCQIF